MPGSFIEALTAALKQLTAGARDEFIGAKYAGGYRDEYWLDFTPEQRDANQFAVFTWRLAVLWGALYERQGGPDWQGPGALASRYRTRYQKLTAGWSR